MIKKTLLWWGRFDPDYSRNRIIRQHLKKLNFNIFDFRPLISKFGYEEALLKNIIKTDLVWVPCFRQRDILSANKWCEKKGIKLVIDPLISSWDKMVNEKGILITKKKSDLLKAKESFLFNKADFILADTDLHANFFREKLNVKESKIFTLYVGAEDAFFKPSYSKTIPNNIFEILFYGSFISLQGTQTIIKAAKLCSNHTNIRWTLLGSGPDLDKCKKLAETYSNIFFEKDIEYSNLASRINKADLLLGIFGNSNKAENVIPNKVFQSLACGKTIITRKSNAYPKGILKKDNGIIFVEPNNPIALYEAVLKIFKNKNSLQKSNDQARNIYETYFSEKIIGRQLKNILK
ncbi:MAG: glycosyltransferase [Methylophilaceae bacterium]